MVFLPNSIEWKQMVHEVHFHSAMIQRNWQLFDDPVVPTGDGDGSFVWLHITKLIELSYPVALFHVPEQL